VRTLLGIVCVVLLAGRGGPAPAPDTPVLVELFTSEGCSSCPPADALLAALEAEQPVPGAEIVPLGLHVDYWDRLGWKDPFSSADYTARQQAYAGPLGGEEVYTPQVVVDGQVGVVGSDAPAIRAAVAAAAARPHLAVRVTARTSGDGIRLTVDLPAAPAGAEKVQVFAALTEAAATTRVTRGENRGRTLQHVAVVRKLESLGPLDAESAVAEGAWRIDRKWNAQALRAVVWLQGEKTRHVLGAATAPVQR
jgi:hypothetical protein